jgi:hypothetical protein
MRRCARRALVCSELPSGVRSTAASATNRRRTTSSSVNVTSSGRSTIRDSRTAASSHLSPGPLSRCPQGFREPRGQPVDEPPQIPGPALPHCRRPRPHYRVAGGGGAGTHRAKTAVLGRLHRGLSLDPPISGGGEVCASQRFAAGCSSGVVVDGVVADGAGQRLSLVAAAPVAVRARRGARRAMASVSEGAACRPARCGSSVPAAIGSGGGSSWQRPVH